MIQAYFSGEKVFSGSQDAFNWCDRSFLGEKKYGKVAYADIEALYLVSSRKMEVFSGSRKVDEDSLIRKFKRKDKDIEIKLALFSDLRKKGYIVKTALKFGADFRVYDKGDKPGKNHAKWLAFTAREGERMKWQDFAAKSRVAHSTKKVLLLGIVDEEGDVTYYEVGWIKP